MKRHFLYLIAIIVGLAVVGGALFLALRSSAVEGPVSAPLAALTVRPIMASEQRWPHTLSAVGSVAAWQEVVISAEIGGQRLERLLVDVGDQVKQGQLLAELSTGTLEAELKASRAVLQEAEVNAAQARRAAQRARSLRGTEVLSEQAYDQAMAARDAAQARVAAAQARVQADTLRLAFTQVFAPDDGVISARSAVEGALIEAGSEMLRLQRQGRLEWRAELPSHEIARVTPGQSVRVTIDNSQPFEGRVRQIAPQLDPDSRIGIVYVDLPTDARLRAGMFASGEFLLAERTVLTLPETAVLLRDGFSYVFLIDGNRVQQQKVGLGARYGERVEIREGLAIDTVVVESGVAFLADGLVVHVVGRKGDTIPTAD